MRELPNPPKPSPITERTLLDALAAKFAPEAYAFLEHVPDSTGSVNRTIDGIAMGLWPSRGLDLHGFEVKISRGDWLRELKNPKKAEGWRFDYFWLVTPLDVVKPDEVPHAWGLMELRPTTRKLTVTKPAPDMKPEAITRRMLAALMRKVHKRATNADDLAAERKRGFDEGFASANSVAISNAKTYREQYEKLEKEVEMFRQASGISINRYSGGKDLGKLVETVRRLGYHGIRNRLVGMVNDARGLHDALSLQLTELEQRQSDESEQEA